MSDDLDARTRQLMAERERKRNQRNQFDPIEDSASNTRRIKIKTVYEELLEMGKDDVAEHLRSIERVGTQERVATELLVKHDLDATGVTYD